MTRNLAAATPAVVSVFAGRIADTGRDPVPLMTEALQILRERPQAELLWASPRELLNVFQADAIGCHIITVTDDLLKKLALVGKDLSDYSRETVADVLQGRARRGLQHSACRLGGCLLETLAPAILRVRVMSYPGHIPS